MLKSSQQKIKEIREDYLYEFVNLLEFLSDKEDFSEEVFDQVSKSIQSDHIDLEAGYNNLKRIITGSFLRIKNGQNIVQESKPIELEFYESFNDRATMSKKQAASLCEKSETWINKHTIKGNLYTREFLKWLKGYNINYYILFRENYRKIS